MTKEEQEQVAWEILHSRATDYHVLQFEITLEGKNYRAYAANKGKFGWSGRHNNPIDAVHEVLAMPDKEEIGADK